MNHARVFVPAAVNLTPRAVIVLTGAVAAVLVIGVGLVKPERLDAVIPAALFGALAVTFAVYRAPELLGTWAGRCALGLVCYMPLSNSPPARLLKLWLDVDHLGWTVIFLPESMLAAGLAVSALRRRQPRLRRHWVALVCLGLLFTGGALSLIPSPDRAATFSTLWLGVVAPGLAYLGTSAGRFSASARRTLLVALLCSTLALLILGLIGYVSDFGLPFDTGALTLNKSRLSALGAYEGMTLGNASHMAGFLMLILPASLLFVTLDKCGGRLERGVALACVVLGTLNLLAILIRSAILLDVALAAIMAVYALAVRPRRVWIPAAVLIVLVGGVVWSGSSGYFTALIPRVEAAQRLHRAHGAAPSADVVQRVPQAATDASQSHGSTKAHEQTIKVADPSAKLRAAAAGHGIEVFMRHPWLGVGMGVYQSIDPVYTAPQNFLIQQAAECGVAGLAGALFMALLAIVCLPDVQGSDVNLCLWSSLAIYIVYIFPMGGNLALMNLGIWGMTFWLFAALLVSEDNASKDERRYPVCRPG